MAFETNRFCWHGCISNNPEAAKAFYSETIGWQLETSPMGDGEASFFTAAGERFAHVASPAGEGTPSHWNNFLRVDDVDKSVKTVVANGGTQLTPPTDIPPGRFSVVASPSGATFTLFREASDDSEHHPGGEGGVHWVELHSKDTEADLKWLKKSFGFSTEVMEMEVPGGGDYTLLKSGETVCGGVMASQEENAPSMWMTWIHVANVDETLGRASRNGGSIVAPAFDVPTIGRIGIVADPTGGVIGVITPPND